MQVYLEVKGLEELTKKLNQLPVEIERDVLVSALRLSANQVKKLAQAKVPIGTGALRDSIRIRAPRRKEHFVQKVLVTVGKYYGKFIESGWMHVGDKHIPARPFMRPAIDEHEKQFIDSVLEGIKKKLKRMKLA